MVNERKLGLVCLMVSLQVFFSVQSRAQTASTSPTFTLLGRSFVDSATGASRISIREKDPGFVTIGREPCNDSPPILTYRGGRDLLFTVGAVHTLLHRVELFGHVFTSDNMDPLQFRVDSDGYSYVKGTGTVTLSQANDFSTRGTEQFVTSTDKKIIYFPRGMDRSTPSQIPVIPQNQDFSVCEASVKVSSMTRAAKFEIGKRAINPGKKSDEFLIVKVIGLNKRITVTGLVDANGKIFAPTAPPLKPNDPQQLDLTLFEVPKGAVPKQLEIEGIFVDVQRIPVDTRQTPR